MYAPAFEPGLFNVIFLMFLIYPGLWSGEVQIIKYRTCIRLVIDRAKCYECNQPRHLRVDCPSFKKRIARSEKKTFNDKKAKKAYITWEDNDMDSSEDSDNEVVNLSLMAKNYESDEEVTSSNKNRRKSLKVYQSHTGKCFILILNHRYVIT